MIHPLSDIRTKDIGKNTTIWQYVVVLDGAKIGSNVNINCFVFIEDNVIIGNNVTIKPGVQVWNGVIIEDDVFVGPNVTFINDLVPRSKIFRKNYKQTILKKKCSIGANATILVGVEIGEFSFIGAGSVVTKNVPPFTVWYGNPAKHQGYITEEGNILDLNLIEKISGLKYRIYKNKLQIDD